MRTFIEKLCDRYKVSETDVQSLLNYMEEVHFKKRDLIVREGTKNCNLYFIKTGIWRAYYHKDGVDTTIWFASDGEAAFSVWGYVDNAYSLINIEVMCDSVAYCISRTALNQQNTGGYSTYGNLKIIKVARIYTSSQRTISQPRN